MLKNYLKILLFKEQPLIQKQQKQTFYSIKYGNFQNMFLFIVYNSEKYLEILASFMTLEILLESNPCSPQINQMNLLIKKFILISW